MPDPEQRFQNASEMRAALAAALSEPERRRARRRRVASALLTLAGLGLLGVAGYGQAHPEMIERARATAQSCLDYVTALREQYAVSQARVAKIALPSGSEVVASARPGAALSGATAREPDPGSSATGPAGELEDQVTDQESDEPTQARIAQNEPENGEAAEGEGVRDPAPEPAAGSGQSEASDLGERLSRAEELIQQGHRLKGYHQIRALGMRHGQEGRVLKAWCQAAVALRQWGEAYKVAERWAATERSTESRLELARMERALGNRSQAIRIVNDALKSDPESEPAQKLLASLRQGPSRVARNGS
jgi:tetratricopeptide (TPR) repeat protein